MSQRIHHQNEMSQCVHYPRERNFLLSAVYISDRLLPCLHALIKERKKARILPMLPCMDVSCLSVSIPCMHVLHDGWLCGWSCLSVYIGADDR